MKWENCKCKECGLCLGPTLRPCNGNIYTACKEEKDWISVKNRLPETGIFVLTVSVDAVIGRYDVERYDGELYEDQADVYFSNGCRPVTHWRYLPDVPGG